MSETEMFASLQVCIILKDLIWYMTHVENHLIAVDRISEYSNTKPEVPMLGGFMWETCIKGPLKCVVSQDRWSLKTGRINMIL